LKHTVDGEPSKFFSGGQNSGFLGMLVPSWGSRANSQWGKYVAKPQKFTILL